MPTLYCTEDLFKVAPLQYYPLTIKTVSSVTKTQYATGFEKNQP